MAVTTEAGCGDHVVLGRLVTVTRVTWRGKPGAAYDLTDTETGETITAEGSFGGYPTAGQMTTAVLEWEHAKATEPAAGARVWVTSFALEGFAGHAGTVTGPGAHGAGTVMVKLDSGRTISLPAGQVELCPGCDPGFAAAGVTVHVSGCAAGAHFTPGPGPASYRGGGLNPDREFRVLPQEASHYRGSFRAGDVLRVDGRHLARLIGWDHTWSHLRSGRIAILQPLVTWPGVPAPTGTKPYASLSGTITSWETGLSAAKPGDVGAHLAWPDGRTSGFGYRNVGPSWEAVPAGTT
jgi:hypothetical protein